MSQETIYSILLSLQKQKQFSSYYNITWRQGKILSTIVQTYQPANILEIGTANGYSSLWIKYGCSQSKLTTVEISEELAKKAQENFKKAQITVELINKSIFEIDFNTKYDMVFIDALQQKYEEVIEYLFEKQILNASHFFVFDNIDSHNKKSSIKQFLEKKGYETHIIEEGSTFLIALYSM